MYFTHITVHFGRASASTFQYKMFCNSMFFSFIHSDNAQSMYIHCLMCINNFFWNSIAQETTLYMKEGDGMSGHIQVSQTDHYHSSRLLRIKSKTGLSRFLLTVCRIIFCHISSVSCQQERILHFGLWLNFDTSKGLEDKPIVWLIFENRPFFSAINVCNDEKIDKFCTPVKHML